MASLTKTERNRIHKVRERDRVRKQMQAEGLPVPPLHDPDNLGRGPGDGPSPVGSGPRDEETKPTAAQVARETRAGFNARWEPVPSIELVAVKGNAFTIPEKKEGDVRPPSKQILRDIHDYKEGSKDTNYREPAPAEEQQEYIEKGMEGLRNAGAGGKKVSEETKGARKNAATRAEDVEHASVGGFESTASGDGTPHVANKPKKTDDETTTTSAAVSSGAKSDAKTTTTGDVGDRLVTAVRDAANDPEDDKTTPQTRSTDRPLPGDAVPPKDRPHRGTASFGARVPPGVDGPNNAKKRGS